MPNKIPAAGEAMSERKFDISDLENPIEEARRMASILATMVEDIIGGNRCKVPGRDDTYLITASQRDDLAFAAYHNQDMISKIREMWEPLA